MDRGALTGSIAALTGPGIAIGTGIYGGLTKSNTGMAKQRKWATGMGAASGAVFGAAMGGPVGAVTGATLVGGGNYLATKAGQWGGKKLKARNNGR